MKTTFLPLKFGLAGAALSLLAGCTTYVVQQPPPQPDYAPPPAQPVYVQPAPTPEPPPAVVVIQREDDFYAPLSPYGEWVTVDGYGRCWRPAHVETSWRPYSSGHWELTDQGWYWDSDEPWGWATYHYGRWSMVGNYGWVWVPQTEWAPAWVTWREGGGYVGWAPAPPAPRAGVVVSVAVAPAAFCFVEENRIHETVRPTTVIINNTTVINKTVNITKTKIVNKVVINEGPRVDEVERANGGKIQTVAVKDLRHKDEAPVAEQHPNLRRPSGDRPETPVMQRAPEPRQEAPPQNVHNNQHELAQPTPVSQPAAHENEKPARNEQARPEQLPTGVQRQAPRPATQSMDSQNNRDRIQREQNPPQTPSQRDAHPAEKPSNPPQSEMNNNDRHPQRQAQPEAQPQQPNRQPPSQMQRQQNDQGNGNDHKNQDNNGNNNRKNNQDNNREQRNQRGHEATTNAPDGSNGRGQK